MRIHNLLHARVDDGLSRGLYPYRDRCLGHGRDGHVDRGLDEHNDCGHEGGTARGHDVCAARGRNGCVGRDRDRGVFGPCHFHLPGPSPCKICHENDCVCRASHGGLFP